MKEYWHRLSGREKALIISRRSSSAIWKICRTFLLIGVEFTLLYPLLFIVVTAFRSQADLMNPSVVWITRHWSLENVRQLFDIMDYPKLISFSLQISVVSAVLQMFVCALAGYGFARFEFKGKKLLTVLLLATIIVPVQTYISPLFMTFRFFRIPGVSWLLGLLGVGENGTLSLIDSPAAFWVQSLFGMGFKSGLFIYIYRQFYRNLPTELEEAAKIDGCSPFGTYFRVMMPNAVPAMSTVGMFSFVWHWNDYYMVSMLSTNRSNLSVALAQLRTLLKRQVFESQAGGQSEILIQTLVQAGAFLCVVPMLLLFLFGQRFFTESVDRTGIVG
jgi:multiple sugar transport system permease protein